MALVLVAFVVVVTEFASNIAAASGIMPVVGALVLALGADPIPMGAREFDKFIGQQAQRFVELAKQANIKAE